MEYDGKYYFEKFQECAKKNSQKELALYYLMQSAKLEYSFAISMMSGLYFYDDFGMQDYQKAMYWAKKAEKFNDANANTILGVLYLEGKGVQTDAHKAIKYLNRAIQKEGTKAYRYLGMCYQKGLGVKKDEEKAFELYKLGANKQDITSQYLVGECYEKGIGIDQDYEEAFKWYELAARRGDKISLPAMLSLGRFYTYGLGVIKDNKNGENWYHKAKKLQNKKYRAIIFDLDGVICFTDQYHYLAWKQLADELAIPFNKSINNRLRGVSREKSLEIILEQSNKTYTYSEKKTFLQRKNEMYRKSLENMTPEDLSVDVVDTLGSLRKQGLLLAIGSSSKNTKFILEKIGLRTFFDKISDGNNITYSKPNPEVFLKAAKYLNVAPNECLVVEDAEAGIEAALSGGFDCAALAEAAKTNKATYNLKQLSDILKIFE